MSSSGSRSPTPSSLTSSNSTSSSSLIDNCEFIDCINPDAIFPVRRHPFRLSSSSANGMSTGGHRSDDMDASLGHEHHQQLVKQQLFNSSSDDDDEDDEEEIDVVSVKSSSKQSAVPSAFLVPQAPFKTPLNHNHHNYFTPIGKKQQQQQHQHQTTVVVASNKVKAEPMTDNVVTKCSSAKKQQFASMTSLGPTGKASSLVSKQLPNTVVNSVKKQNNSMTVISNQLSEAYLLIFFKKKLFLCIIAKSRSNKDNKTEHHDYNQQSNDGEWRQWSTTRDQQS